eukprot:CAMPEP_0198427438 /NCGR_PEP_ID=MMETSP1452-20131203/5912_1 /TAXON_ID=1181717 /ORGANISM="Synchroma pusillum, Strain CCMP3072" /LENGTH=302 /DNA_ID=CAMNT_0044147815 /DNA_START=64 /DNA_END=972 /DNA_ORIENTATION=-
MGALLDTLLGSDPVMNVTVPFDGEAAGEQTGPVAEALAYLETQGRPALEAIKSYGNGGQEYIRHALSNQKDEQAQLTAFDAISPNIKTIQSFHTAAEELARRIMALLPRLNAVAQFQQDPNAARALGELLLFMYEFDGCKMQTPDLQNDFSFYRRVLSKASQHRTPPVTEAEANVVSMFIAQAVPLTASVATVMVNENADPTPVAKLANLCCGMVQRSATSGEGERLKVLTVMVACIVLYDRVNRAGAFNPSASPVKMRRCAAILGRIEGADRDLLRNSIKYSTVHYSDPTTPDGVRSLLGD